MVLLPKRALKSYDREYLDPLGDKIVDCFGETQLLVVGTGVLQGSRTDIGMEVAVYPVCTV